MTVSDVETLLLGLVVSDRPERSVTMPPVDEYGFLRLVQEAHPELEHQCHRADGAVVHVFQDRLSNEFVVLFSRDNGQYTVKESGFPWLERLQQLAAMWEAAAVPRRGAA